MARRPRKVRRTFPCPHCGAEVYVDARVCKACGSDAETGWQDENEITYQSLDIPDGWGPEAEKSAGGGAGSRWWVPVVAIVVALAMLLFAMRVWSWG